MKKKTFAFIVLIAAVYLLLLALLTLFESRSPDSSIGNFFEAFWYSLATMTTVGYGDMVPVSRGGRAIGLVFIILSAGIMAAILYSVSTLIRTRLHPFIRLLLVRGRTCCFFSELNEASDVLAADLAEKEPGSRMIFCGTGKDGTSAYTLKFRGAMILSQSLESAIRASMSKKTRESGGMKAFLVSDDEMKNKQQAAALSGQPVAVYCRAGENSALPGVHFFDEYACAARQYWQENPLTCREKILVLIGSGKRAETLMDYAVLAACRPPFVRTVFHLFGDWDGYFDFRQELTSVFDRNGEDTGKDKILVHSEPWNRDRALLESADRILFCDDDRKANGENALMLDRYFAVSGRAFAAADEAGMPAETFGRIDKLFTREYVMLRKLDQRAASLHAAYLASVNQDGPAFEELPVFLRDSNRAAADHLLTKLAILLPEQEKVSLNKENCGEAFRRWQAAEDKEPYRENEHERWRRFHCLRNWRYGEEKEPAKRTHPCMVPYEQLSEAERIKDDNAWRQIGDLPGTEEER